MNLMDICKDLGCNWQPPNLEVQGVAINSRLVSPGFVFFALASQVDCIGSRDVKRVDGHDFLQDALEKGAIAAVVSKEFVGEVKGLHLIRVPDVLKAFHKLAANRVSESGIPCVAITGSVGKTTTKEFVADLLSAQFQVNKPPGNANSQRGLPLSILNEKIRGDVRVAEMAMDFHGQIANLIKIAPPDIAVVTKIGLSHSWNFPGGREEIAEAKSEILSHPSTKKAFINAQARQFEAFQKKRDFPVIFYGLASSPYVQSGDVVLKQTGKTFSIEKDGVSLVEGFSLPFTAEHLLENFLVAALAASEMEVSWEQIRLRAAGLKGAGKRFEKVEKKGVTYVNDTYNANPESVKAALRNLPLPEKGGKVIAVLGEMRELGTFSEGAHQEIGKVASEHVDELFCFAGDARHMAESFSLSGKLASFFAVRNELENHLQSRIKKGDVVLLKGSKSLKLWELLDLVE